MQASRTGTSIWDCLAGQRSEVEGLGGLQGEHVETETPHGQADAVLIWDLDRESESVCGLAAP